MATKQIVHLMTLFAFTTMFGCKSKEQGVPTSNGRGNEVIRSGYGIASCHIGMAATELGDGWVKANVPIGEYMENKSFGLEIKHEDGKITAVFFHFMSPGFQSYQGTTDKGIGSTSTLDDVRSKYGKPSFASQSLQSDLGEFPGAREDMIAFKGIYFTFINDKLASIVAMKPEGRKGVRTIY